MNGIIVFMRSVLKIFFSILLVVIFVMAGIFCYQGVQTINSHCSGDSVSAWCSDFTLHGTIISDAIINTIFTILSILVAIVLIKPFLHLFKNIRQTTFYTPTIRDKIPILSPIQLAMSDGIIHPRIP